MSSAKKIRKVLNWVNLLEIALLVRKAFAISVARLIKRFCFSQTPLCLSSTTSFTQSENCFPTTVLNTLIIHCRGSFGKSYSSGKYSRTFGYWFVIARIVVMLIPLYYGQNRYFTPLHLMSTFKVKNSCGGAYISFPRSIVASKNKWSGSRGGTSRHPRSERGAHIFLFCFCILPQMLRQSLTGAPCCLFVATFY